MQLKLPFIVETVRDRTMVTMNHTQEVIGSQMICVGSDDLKWSWKVGTKDPIIPVAFDLEWLNSVW